MSCACTFFVLILFFVSGKFVNYEGKMMLVFKVVF